MRVKEQSTQSRNKIKRAKKGNQETESRNEALSQETERSGKKQRIQPRGKLEVRVRKHIAFSQETVKKKVRKRSIGREVRG